METTRAWAEEWAEEQGRGGGTNIMRSKQKGCGRAGDARWSIETVEFGEKEIQSDQLTTLKIKPQPHSHV
jgi:hypothetical protein